MPRQSPIESLIEWIIKTISSFFNRDHSESIANTAEDNTVANVKPVRCSARGELLSAAERSFYGVLLLATSNKDHIFAKVRIGDVIKTTDISTRNRLNQKHVDFVLCDKETIRPIVAIELDDASHDAEDRIERDGFVDAAFACAKIPIVHLKARHAYTPQDIRTAINDALG